MSAQAWPIRSLKSSLCIAFMWHAVWLAPSALAQCPPEWVQRFDVPAARVGPAMVYDSRREVVVLFGGNGAPADEAELRQLWEWDGTRWNHRPDVTGGPVGSHGALSWFDAAYDPLHGVTIVRGRHGAPHRAEMWEFDGQTWTLRTTGGPLSTDVSMTYDSWRGVVVLHDNDDEGTWEWDRSGWRIRDPGPTTGELELAFDDNRGVAVGFGYTDGQARTWEWDGQTWRLAAEGGPPVRGDHGMAYDPLRKRVVIYGGGFGNNRRDDTWAWNGANWQFISAGQPTKRSNHGMVYDAARDRMVVFAGSNLDIDEFGDTWTFDGDTWTLADEGEPAGRTTHGMAYDSARDRLVLFGGSTGGLSGDMDEATWEHDGVRWVRVTEQGPPARRGPMMAYDSRRGVTVLFGGYRLGNVLGDTWEWDGETWSLRATTGPAPRWFSQMTYDSARGVCVLFGGKDEGQFNYQRMQDTWEWDGDAWTLRATTGPPRRSDFGMCYDTARAVSVVFGGVTVPVPGQPVVYEDTWAWDGNVWTQLANSGPAARYDHAMAFDEFRGVALVLGGWNSPDVWEWDGVVWAEVPGEAPTRSSAVMSYVASRQSISLFGGGSRRSDHWDFSSPVPTPGDLNCDCEMNAFDIEPFVLALADPEQYELAYPHCNAELADMNGDGAINAFDIEPFVEALVNP